MRRLIAEIVRGRHVILHGNVHDVALWNHRFMPVTDVLNEVLGVLGFDLIGRFDQVDGLSFSGQDGARRFAELLGGQAAAGPATSGPPTGAATSGPPTGPATGAPAGAGQGAGPGPAGSRAERAGAARMQMAGSLAAGAAEPPRYHQPREAVAAIRRGLAQSRTPAAFIMDFADLLLLDPEHNDRNDRDLLLLVKKAMMESQRAANSAVGNQLLLVTSDLAAVPAWLYHDEPFVRPVRVPLPSYQERRAYLEVEAPHYFGYQPGDHNAEPVRVLANLTEGMALAELSGLQRTSRLDKLPLANARELVNRAVFGQREDPWARLVERIPRASAALAQRVIGQPVAVERVSRGLAAATLGVDFVADPFSVEARPKGVFFFAGPTGVGKTELAKALSQAGVRRRDGADPLRHERVRRQEHAAERLIGAPPGYVGFERGRRADQRGRGAAVQCAAVRRDREGAPAAFDKFLQILEDGRLTDGQGQTTYFSQR